MQFLPEDIDCSQLNPLEKRRLEYFYEHHVARRYSWYGEGHFLLACYAALPAVLTADLVHKLWQNFNRYYHRETEQVIHPVAPTDLLLSPLVEEIGFELYEMPTRIRETLLGYLKEKNEADQKNEVPIDKRRYAELKSVARFLYQYARYDFTPDNPNDDAFREAQEWTALSYLDPAGALQMIKKRFRQSANQSSEQARFSDAYEKMSSRFSLNLTENNESIPDEMQPVVKLKTITRSILTGKTPDELKEFQEKTDGNYSFSDQKSKTPGVISIEVPLVVREKMDEALRTSSIHTILIGTNQLNQNTPRYDALVKANMDLMEATFKSIFPKESHRLTRLLADFGNQITLVGLVNQIRALIATIQPGDEVFVYMNLPTGGDPDRQTQAILDTLLASRQLLDLKSIIQNISCKRLVMIAEAPKDVFRVVSQSEYSNMIVIGGHKPDITTDKKGQIGTVTKCLADLINETHGRITIEELVRKSNMQITDEDTWNSAVRVNAHPDRLIELFNPEKQPLARMQTLLRSNHFYNGPTNGVWDEPTADAYIQYCKEFRLPENSNKQSVITHLQQSIENGEKSRIPVFLLIYADPEKKIAEREKERKQVLNLLQPFEKARTFELQVLINPSKQQVADFLKAMSNRDRVELIYYSGTDIDGNFVMSDSEGVSSLSAFELGELLTYQRRLKLLISNTCNSARFCEYLTQSGVPMAVGAKDLVDGQYGSDFGVRVFKSIIETGSLPDDIWKDTGFNINTTTR